MFETLEQLAQLHPFLRRYPEHGFALKRPVLHLELEFDIENANQTLRVNRETSDVRAVAAFEL